MTDDSILSMAVMDGAIRGLNDEEASRAEIAKSIKAYARTHRRRGYGSRFQSWIDSDSLEGYNSLGNGSAMRVSSIAYLYGSLEQVERFAEISAMPTHDHPEGVLGAKATAGAAFLALEGASKDEIERYVVSCGYELPPSVEYLRETYRFDERCRQTVPPAIRCVLDADSFEECIRNCIWIGGDVDTVGAIAGGIAEAMWGVPDEIRDGAFETIERDSTPGLLPEVVSRYRALHLIRSIRKGELPPEDK